MPCTSEKNRSDDKYTAWENAYADQVAAGIANTAADAAVLVACPFFWTGLGTVACAAAVTAAATAAAVLTGAMMKNSAAADAYHKAWKAYQACLAKCKKK